MTTENETTATPAEQATAEQVQEVEKTSTEATAEQTQVETPEAAEEKAKKEPWFQKRIGELTREKYEARRAAEEAAREAREVREQLARIQQGEQQEKPNGIPPEEVHKVAQRLVAEERFNEACNKVYATGKTEFQDFDAALSNLQMVGMNRELLEFVSASDAGAKLIHHLGKDLDEAARIVAMPPVQMARELTRLELKLSQQPAKPVSKTPAPITPITGAGGTSKDPSDMTDAEFAAWRKEQIAKRH